MNAAMHLPMFYLKQKFAMTTNRYELLAATPDGSFGQSLGVAQQKRMAFKEEVTFYADESKARRCSASRPARRSTSTPATTSSTRRTSQIGFFRKDFGKSLLRSTFHVEGAGYTGTGQERSQAVAPAPPVRRHPVPADPLRLRHPGGPAAARCRAAGLGARPLHGARPRPAGRLPGRGSDRGRTRRADAAVVGRGHGAVPRRPPCRRGGGCGRTDVGRGVRRAPRPAPRHCGWRPRSRARRSPRSATSTPTACAAGCTGRFRTPTPGGLIVHLHGGGFVFNDIDVHDAACRRFANRAGLPVLSVDYRLAPEHPFPAAPRRRRRGARLARSAGRPRRVRRTSTATVPAATSRWSRRCGTPVGSARSC